jgi:uncharacterized membrane protein SirB2
MDYLVIKTVHQTAVALSITGFIARGLGSLQGARWVQGRVAKTLPHAIDTVLLLSAVTLAWTASLNPLHTPWLLAKIGALFAYVALGSLALKRTRSPSVRRAAGLAALATFAYIVSVAISKNPLGFLAFLPQVHASS